MYNCKPKIGHDSKHSKPFEKRKEYMYTSMIDRMIMTTQTIFCLSTHSHTKHIVHEPDQMSVPLLVANAIIPFWKAFGVRNEKKCGSQSDSVAYRFYKHFKGEKMTKFAKTMEMVI